MSCVDHFYCMSLLFYFYTVLFVTVGLQNIFNNLIGKKSVSWISISLWKDSWWPYRLFRVPKTFQKHIKIVLIFILFLIIICNQCCALCPFRMAWARCRLLLAEAELQIARRTLHHLPWWAFTRRGIKIHCPNFNFWVNCCCCDIELKVLLQMVLLIKI